MPQYQGVWTLPVAARLQSTQQWATDPLYRNTTLLLQADNAANAAQNNTFLDSSSNNFTITRNGNTTQGTFTPYSLQPGAWSNFFDGSGDYISAPANAAFNFGTGDFTIEFWYYPNSISGARTLIEVNYGTAPNFIMQPSSGVMNFYTNGVSAFVASNVTDTIGSWYHYAAVRNGSTITLYRNGISVGTTTYSGNVGNSSAVCFVGGSLGGGGYYIDGYLSNVRVVKGAAVYTSNFTPSPIPLTAITNTSLLTCQSNRFVDNSANGFVISVAGNTSVQAFSPFAPQYQWTAPVIGGSGYFDGNTDYLTLTQSAFAVGTGNYTLEAWVYLTATPGTEAGVISSFNTGGGQGFYLAINSSRQPFFAVGNGATSNPTVTGTAIPLNTWTHLAGVRSSGTISLYVNGVSVGTPTSATASIDRTLLGIGLAYPNSPQGYITGYISNARVTSAAVYSGTFTIPTAPFTGTMSANPFGGSNTAAATATLLCNFTNAGIVDGTMKNNLETVGNAQVSTSIVKYGTGSMAFDGTGDYLVTPSSPVNILGSGDFTIEFWAYPNNTSSAYRALVASENYNATTGGWSIYQNGASIEVWLSPGTPSSLINATSALTAATWQHVALSRASGTVRLFVNGTSIASASNTAEWTGQRIFIGDNNYAGTDYFYNGYIDDLRITKGVARYTANFTPPTVALPRQ